MGNATFNWKVPLKKIWDVNQALNQTIQFIQQILEHM